MSTSSSTELRGRPIRGDVEYYGNRGSVPQRPIEEFLAALDALLDLDGVAAVRWEQYTPYFNDGEPCSFGVCDAGVRFADSDEFTDDGTLRYPPGYFSTHAHKVYDRPTGAWAVPKGMVPANYRDMTCHVNGVERPDIDSAFDRFNEALTSGAYDDQLHDSFGDPAQVTATAEGFDVEFYEHD